MAKECANAWRGNCSDDWVTVYTGAPVPFTNCGYHSQMCEFGLYWFDGIERLEVAC